MTAVRLIVTRAQAIGAEIFATGSVFNGVSPLIISLYVFPPVSGTPAIAGIFGKDWCMNLWKDREPGSLERASDAPQSLMEVRIQ